MTQKETKMQTDLTAAYRFYEKRLNVHAFFKTHNHEMSQDLVQNTFKKTWTYLVKGGKIETMKAFLYHVLNNLIIDEYRKEKHKTASLDSLIEKGFMPSADDYKSLLNTIDGRKALLLINDLPKIYQDVMNMKYLEDLSLKEISEISGKSKNTVTVQMHRGIEKIKKLYKF
jgi:RNA polymerase sigma-70 factor (ECF subfamily)